MKLFMNKDTYYALEKLFDEAINNKAPLYALKIEILKIEDIDLIINKLIDKNYFFLNKNLNTAIIELKNLMYNMKRLFGEHVDFSNTGVIYLFQNKKAFLSIIADDELNSCIKCYKITLNYDK